MQIHFLAQGQSKIPSLMRILLLTSTAELGGLCMHTCIWMRASFSNPHLSFFLSFALTEHIASDRDPVTLCSEISYQTINSEFL